MKMRKLAGWLAIPAFLAVAGALAWWWLLHTEPGARWLIQKSGSVAAAVVEAAGITGNLHSGLQLDRLRFEQNGTRVEAESVRLAINVDVLPIAVEVNTLHAENIRISIAPGSGQESGDKNVFAMPFPLTFGDVKLSGIQYLDTTGETSVAIDQIEGAGGLTDRLVLHRLSISQQENRLEVSGQAAFAPPHVLDLEFQSQGRVTMKGSLDGDLDSAQVVVDIADPQVHVSGTLGQLLRNPVWDLELTSASIQLPPESADPTATLVEMRATTIGEWPEFDLELAAVLETPWLESVQLLVAGSGTRNDFAARKITVYGPEVSLQGAGTISWKETLRLGVTANLEYLEPGKWLPDWPENHPLSGGFAARWEGEDLEISDFNLLVSGTGFAAKGHGVVALEAGIIDAALTWENFSWPISSPSPALESKIGSLRISGKPEKWELEGSLDLQSGDFPPGRLQLSGTGDSESVAVTVPEGDLLGGSFSGSLFWNWTGNQPFNADVVAEKINIEPLFSEYPGLLNTRLTLKGEVEPFQLDIGILQLNGTISGHPVNGQGGLHIAQKRVFADRLHLSSGLSTLDLDGSLYDPGGLDFAAEIDSLARFRKDFEGSVAARGTLSLDPDSPRISMVLSGQDLLLGALRIDRLETREVEGGTDSEIVLTGLVIGPRIVDSAVIRFGGEEPLQRLGIRAHIEDTDLMLELKGSVVDWANPAVSGWSGELSDLRIERADQFKLALDQAAALEWSPARFLLEPFCLNGDAHLCLASNWRSEQEFSINAELAKVPIGLFKLISETELEFTQILSGTLNWSQSRLDGRRGVARFELSPGTISLPDDDEILLETGAGRFGFELAGGVLQNGDLDIAIPDTGEVDIDFNIPDFGPGADSPVFGHVRIDFHDLSALEPVLPFLDSINGTLDIDVDVSGLLSDPRFTGRAALANGRFSNDASGFSFSEINLSGDVNDQDRSNLRGTFRAGVGTGTINATIYFENMISPALDLELKGESLTVIDVPDLNVITNPDLSMRWRDNTLEINGRVFVPTARLAPNYIPRATIRQSADVVIVAGELPESEDDLRQKNPLKIRGSLEFELGNEAVVELERAKVNVSGTTRFTWQDELLPMANGNFDVRGDIQAYGQFLKITQGRISFPEIPADNPHLNIRAEREIYGNSQIQRAGLMVAGTLKRPLVEPFTVPATNRDRARTLLVTGSDFNYEQGVGAVAVGTYILPKLYVSYGIGVFEEGSVISARYDLGRRFGIKVTSGEKDTGVDLNYRIER